MLYNAQKTMLEFNCFTPETPFVTLFFGSSKMVNKVGIEKKLLGLALTLLFLYACVPAIKDVKNENASKTEAHAGGFAKSVKPYEKGKPPDKKDAIREAWLAGRQLSSEKDKKSGSKKDQNQSPRKSLSKDTDSRETKPEKPLSDEDKVKRAALEIIKETESPKKYMICHDEIKDEWSLVVFDDIGNVLDVKQYFWNMETQKMERFLVLNRIPKSHLKDELSKKSLGKNCSTYQP